jgi:DNA-binding transcriptional ArsR family regulator
MVIGSISDRQADVVFHALADTTRRDIVTRAMTAELSLSALAQKYPMSFAAVHKHVSVLEAAGLIGKRRSGREQLVHAEVDTIRRAQDLLDRFERLWTGRLNRIDDMLTDTNEGKPQ